MAISDMMLHSFGKEASLNVTFRNTADFLVNGMDFSIPIEVGLAVRIFLVHL